MASGQHVAPPVASLLTHKSWYRLSLRVCKWIHPGPGVNDFECPPRNVLGRSHSIWSRAQGPGYSHKQCELNLGGTGEGKGGLAGVGLA